MKFITFQPIKVVNTLNTEGVYKAPSNDRLKNKIFALKVDENTMERIFMCAPSMPQRAIIFESDNYEELDSIAWVNELHLGIKKESNTKYKEYTFDKIEKVNVIEIINISDSEDPDEVQDDFMDMHFKELERLSGHKWFRLSERSDIFGTSNAEELMYYIELCMMPFMEVTEEDFDRLAELFREHFIRK